MRIKIVLFILLSFLFYSCSTQKSITCEKELYDVVNTSLSSYNIELEYNELKYHREGIYLSSIIINQEDTKSILNNIETNNIKNLSDEQYVFHAWKKTPVQNDFDVSLTNYSPVSSNVQNVLITLNTSLTTVNSYYSYLQNVNNPFVNLLYVFIPENNRIIIYYSIF